MFLRELEREILKAANGTSISQLYDKIPPNIVKKQRTMYNIVGFLTEGEYISKVCNKPKPGSKARVCYYTTTEKGHKLLREDKATKSLSEELAERSKKFAELFPTIGKRKSS